MINNKAREISADEFADRQAQINNSLMNLHTAMPAIVVSFNADERTITAQPAIQRVFSAGEGITGPQNLPPCVDVPVMFLGGGGYDITYPIVEGDECLLIFAERCIDSWFTTGKPAPPADYRQHDLSDAFALVGVRSLARQSPVAVDGLRIGNDSSQVMISDNEIILQKGAAKMTLTDKKLECTVDIYAPNVITPSLDLNKHLHDGVEVGAGTTLEGF